MTRNALPPRRTIRPRRPARRATRRILLEFAAAAAGVALLHALCWLDGGHHVDAPAEAMIAAVFVGAWLGLRVVRAMRPRERVATWRRPRGLDAIRRIRVDQPRP